MMDRRLAEGFTGDVVRRESAPVVAVIALGANLGDRAATLQAAVEDLRALPLVDEVRAAEPIESVALKPDGLDAEAPAYLNSVAVITTRLAPSVLLDYLHAIEARHGRERRQHWGDRTLDLDLITYGDVRSTAAALTLPHPHAHERDFVLVPWLAIDPDAILPGKGRADALLAHLRSTA